MKNFNKFLLALILLIPMVTFSQVADVIYCVNALENETYSVVPSDLNNTFSWSADDPNIIFSDASSTNVSIDWTGLTTGTYTLTFTEISSLNPDCEGVVNFIVSIVDGPTIDSVDDIFVCEGTTSVLASANASGSGLTYDWGPSASGNTDSENLDLNLFGATYDGSNINNNLTLNGILIVTDSNGCSTQDNFDITIVNTPEPGAITN